MHIDDRYYEVDMHPSINSVEGVSDAMEWLVLKHKKAYRDAVELDDTREGRRQKKPNRIMIQYDVAKESVISELAHVSFLLIHYDIQRLIHHSIFRRVLGLKRTILFATLSWCKVDIIYTRLFVFVFFT